MIDPARFVVGIPYLYPEYWTGGVYYIKNLVSSLRLLPDRDQPMIRMLCDTEEFFTFVREETAYPHLDWIPSSKITDEGHPLRVDVIFPFPISTDFPQTACWVPDFQEKHLPEFFSVEEIQLREHQHRHYFENFGHMVFSSRAVLADFDRFYPEAKVRRHVLPFAVFERTPEPIEQRAVLEKYGLSTRFFYCPNQFWIHKNHTTVIKAVAQLMSEGIETTVVFSGREYDYRAPDWTAKLKADVAAAGLDKHIRFLGFIPREDQRVILRRAICIVQPSLFEGWSTVIEDAKYVSQYILASRIPSNLEQADANMEFFEPLNVAEVAGLMRKYVTDDPARTQIDYRPRQEAFARAFVEMLRSVSTSDHGGR